MERCIEKLNSDRRLSRRHRCKNRAAGSGATAGCGGADGGIGESVAARSIFCHGLAAEQGSVSGSVGGDAGGVTGVAAAQWLCTGHVVRVVEMDSPRGAHGVGVQFDFYEVSRPEQPEWAMGCAGS